MTAHLSNVKVSVLQLDRTTELPVVCWNVLEAFLTNAVDERDVDGRPHGLRNEIGMMSEASGKQMFQFITAQPCTRKVGSKPDRLHPGCVRMPNLLKVAMLHGFVVGSRDLDGLAYVPVARMIGVSDQRRLVEHH